MKSINSLNILLTVFITTSAFGQKLPAEQQTSLRIPTGYKVDGKATEWNNTFQAYNRHTDLFYTLANNNDKLYLTIQAADPAVIKRIINGALTLTINNSGEKSKKGAATISYPIFEKDQAYRAPYKRRSKLDMSSPIETWTDSVVNAVNKEFSAKAKMIQVTGIKGIDTLISVYNTEGIKAVALFDNNGAYTYELSVPLKVLGLSAGKAEKFLYQIRINDVEGHGISITMKDGSTTTDIASVGIENIQSMNISAGSQVGQAATDFWATYTLIK